MNTLLHARPLSLQTGARWPLALVLLALLAHAPALPLAAWPGFAAALLSRHLPAARSTPVLRLLGLAAVYLACALLYGWLDAATLRLSLLLVLALKWAESRQPREFALVGTAAVVAVAIGLLQWSEGAGLLFVLTAALARVAAAGPAGQTPVAGLRRAGRQLLLALPLAGVLFLFFPRIPGPLWDIGLTFGLPLPASIEKSNQGLGISTRLKPGQTQTGASDGEPVLVAEFANWVPPTSQLYWRGPVFYDFDGQEWRLDADYAEGNGRRIMQRGWRRGSDFARILQSTAQEVHYKIRLTPHDGLWLYGLDLPAKLTAESFIGPDWQVMAHMPVKQEISYELASWLEWTAGGELAPELRERALRLPAGANPRLRARGEELRHLPPAEIPLAALRDLARGGYQVRQRFAAPPGDNALDSFWFDSRVGNSEFYAAAFVVLMRSAGVPARLVSGYRGGKLMALTDYVVVKRSHAHAWAEIWEDGSGWRRIDPTDLVAPEKFAGSQAKSKPPVPAAAPRPSGQSGAASPPQPAAGGFAAAAPAPRPSASPAWALPEIGDWLGRWVFRLDAERQMALLAGQGGGFAWLWLLGTAALLSGLLFAAGLLLQTWREHRRVPLPERLWRRICRQLAGRGLARQPGECPSRYAERLALARPAWATALRACAAAYTDWRYGPTPEAGAARMAAAARLLNNHILSQ